MVFVVNHVASHSSNVKNLSRPNYYHYFFVNYNQISYFCIYTYN